MDISRKCLGMSAPTSQRPAKGIGHGGLALAAVNLRNLKRSVFNPTGSAASISPPFPARTHPRSARGSSGLFLSFSFDKAWRPGGRGDGRPQPALLPKERRVCPRRAHSGPPQIPPAGGTKRQGASALEAPPGGPRSRAGPAGRAAEASCARSPATSAATVPAKISGRRVLIAAAPGGRAQGRARSRRGSQGRGEEGHLHHEPGDDP